MVVLSVSKINTAFSLSRHGANDPEVDDLVDGSGGSSSSGSSINDDGEGRVRPAWCRAPLRPFAPVKLCRLKAGRVGPVLRVDTPFDIGKMSAGATAGLPVLGAGAAAAGQ